MYIQLYVCTDLWILIFCLTDNNGTHNGEEMEIQMQFQSILFFITGEPPLKYSPSPTVCFNHEDSYNPYPRSNTCSNTLYLPTVDMPLEQFLYYMSYGITNTVGFGLI